MALQEGVRTVFTVGASAFSFARFSAALSGYESTTIQEIQVMLEIVSPTHLVVESLTSAY
jgi:hypothetical protein